MYIYINKHMYSLEWSIRINIVAFQVKCIDDCIPSLYVIVVKCHAFSYIENSNKEWYNFVFQKQYTSERIQEEKSHF